MQEQVLQTLQNEGKKQQQRISVVGIVQSTVFLYNPV